MRRDARLVGRGMIWLFTSILLWMTSSIVVSQVDDVLATPLLVEASDGIYRDRIDVHWNAVAGVAWYEVYRSAFPRHMYICIATTKELQIADHQMKASQYYYYKVRACLETGCGPFSEPAMGSWEIGVPEGAFATRGQFADRIRIEWNRVENATLYYVYRSANPDDIDALLYMGYETFLDDFGGLPGKTYYYHVRALTTSTGSALTEPLPGYRDATLRIVSRFSTLTE